MSEEETFDDRAAEGAREAATLLGTSRNRHIVDVALRRPGFGDERERTEDASVDYVVGIESILTSSEPGEVTYKVSNRLAAMIGTDAADRAEAAARMKHLYGVRSKIVHGKPVSGVDELAEEVRRFLRRLVLSVLKHDSLFDVSEPDRRLLSGEYR